MPVRERTRDERGMEPPYGPLVPAIPELDLARIRRFCEDRTPPEFRDEMRVEADVRGRSVTILDCRPPWMPELVEWSRQPLAQLRYDVESSLWTLYWADRNSRWHRYDDLDPGPVGDLLDEIAEDPTCIFWG
jgi:Protein of unknown function (DUF3024)